MRLARRILSRLSPVGLALASTPIVIATAYFILLGCAARQPAAGKVTTLREQVPYASACARLTASLQVRCAGHPVPLDCSQVTACGAQAVAWDGIDLQDCTAAVTNAADCYAAQRTTCSIACSEAAGGRK